MGNASQKIAHFPDLPSSNFHDLHILGKKVGRGAFAQVRIATRVKDKRTAEVRDEVVKILDMRDSDIVRSIHLRNEARKEASNWLRAAKNHSHVVQLHEVFYDPVCCYFVMEKCASGIFHHLETLPVINERSLGKIILQMLYGISQIHSVGVVHRDVKPDNFLVGGEDGKTIKLADFGISAVLPVDGKLKNVAGTAPFMCPEMLKGRPYDEKADLWSLGVVAYVMLLGDFPYVPKKERSKEMKKAIVAGVTPTFQPAGITSGTYRSPTALAFVQNLLERQPVERPSANVALRRLYMVAVAEDRHMPQVELPSLSEVIYSARQKGASEEHNLDKKTDLDDYLDIMQVKTQGISMPGQHSCESSAFTKIRESRESNALTIPENPVSLSSRATTASGGASTSVSLRGSSASIQLNRVGDGAW